MRRKISMETLHLNALFADSAVMATSSEGDQGPHSGVSDSIITEFSSYEDFLDCQITATDLYYLSYLEVTILSWSL